MCTWEQLPYDIKYIIINQLNPIERFNFKLVSKSSKRLIESIPFHCDTVKIFHYDRITSIPTGIVYSSLSFNAVLDYCNFVVENVKETVIINRKNHSKTIELESEEEAKEFVEKCIRGFLMDGMTRMKLFKTNVPHHELFGTTSTTKIHTKTGHIQCKESDDINKWLQNMTNTKQLIITDFNGYTRKLIGIGTNDILLNCDMLTLRGENDISDKELITMKCTMLKLDAWNLTARGITEFLKRKIEREDMLDIQFELIGTQMQENAIFERLGMEMGDIATNPGSELIVESSKEHFRFYWNNCVD